MKTLEVGPLADGYRVIKPIPYEVELDEENGYHIACTIPPICWWGEGSDEGAAVADLISTLIEVYEFECADQLDDIPPVYLDPPVKDYIERVTQ